MSDSEQEYVSGTFKKRKGVRNPTRSDQIKRCRLKGQPYINSSGNTVLMKKPGDSCNCKLQCFHKVSEEARLQAFNEFLNLNTKNEQDIFLQGLLVVKNIKQRRSRNETTSKLRHSSFRFLVKVHEKKVQVCKKAFSSIYSIKNCALYRLQKLLQLGKLPSDQRGKQQNQRVIPAEIILQIREHISTFPVKQSHYASKEYLYLPANLNVKAMHSLFKDKNPGTTAKLSFYYKIFKDHFDLHFGRPQVDACCECERLQIRVNSTDLSERAVMAATAELKVHKKRANKFYASIREVEKLCQERNDVTGLTFDYMQNISLPCIPVQEMFYLRQLSLFPFCIKNLKTKESRFFLYHEGNAMKGPNETCTFLLKYIEEAVSTDIKVLYIFTDTCGGQNRNHAMISLCQALVDTGRFTKIFHRFPIRGHSFLPNDRSFGTVKRVLRRRDRYYLPMEVCEIICNAHRKFSVTMVNTEDILDFKNWWVKHYKRQTVSIETQSRDVPRSEKQQFLVTNFLEFEYSSEIRGCVLTRPFIGNNTRVNTFNLKKSNQHNVTLPTEKAYNAPIPINLKKIKDLERTLQYIPSDKREYYVNIVENWPKTNVTDEE